MTNEKNGVYELTTEEGKLKLRKYKPLPKTQTEKEMLNQIRKALPSDFDEKCARTPNNKKSGDSTSEVEEE